MLALNVGDHISELADEQHTLSEVIFIFLLHLQRKLSQLVVVLAVEVDLIADALEVLIGVVQVVVLLHEVLHGGHLLLEVSQTLLQPLLGLIAPALHDPWDQFLYFHNEFFGSREELSPAALAV